MAYLGATYSELVNQWNATLSAIAKLNYKMYQSILAWSAANPTLGMDHKVAEAQHQLAVLQGQTSVAVGTTPSAIIAAGLTIATTQPVAQAVETTQAGALDVYKQAVEAGQPVSPALVQAVGTDPVAVKIAETYGLSETQMQDAQLVAEVATAVVAGVSAAGVLGLIGGTGAAGSTIEAAIPADTPVDTGSLTPPSELPAAPSPVEVPTAAVAAPAPTLVESISTGTKSVISSATDKVASAVSTVNSIEGTISSTKDALQVATNPEEIKNLQGALDVLDGQLTEAKANVTATVSDAQKTLGLVKEQEPTASAAADAALTDISALKASVGLGGIPTPVLIGTAIGIGVLSWMSTRKGR